MKAQALFQPDAVSGTNQGPLGARASSGRKLSPGAFSLPRALFKSSPLLNERVLRSIQSSGNEHDIMPPCNVCADISLHS